MFTTERVLSLLEDSSQCTLGLKLAASGRAEPSPALATALVAFLSGTAETYNVELAIYGLALLGDIAAPALSAVLLEEQDAQSALSQLRAAFALAIAAQGELPPLPAFQRDSMMYGGSVQQELAGLVDPDICKLRVARSVDPDEFIALARRIGEMLGTPGTVSEKAADIRGTIRRCGDATISRALRSGDAAALFAACRRGPDMAGELKGRLRGLDEGHRGASIMLRHWKSEGVELFLELLDVEGKFAEHLVEHHLSECGVPNLAMESCLRKLEPTHHVQRALLCSALSRWGGRGVLEEFSDRLSELLRELATTDDDDDEELRRITADARELIFPSSRLIQRYAGTEEAAEATKACSALSELANDRRLGISGDIMEALAQVPAAWGTVSDLLSDSFARNDSRWELTNVRTVGAAGPRAGSFVPALLEQALRSDYSYERYLADGLLGVGPSCFKHLAGLVARNYPENDPHYMERTACRIVTRFAWSISSGRVPETAPSVKLPKNIADLDYESSSDILDLYSSDVTQKEYVEVCGAPIDFSDWDDAFRAAVLPPLMVRLQKLREGTPGHWEWLGTFVAMGNVDVQFVLECFTNVSSDARRGLGCCFASFPTLYVQPLLDLLERSMQNYVNRSDTHSLVLASDILKLFGAAGFPFIDALPAIERLQTPAPIQLKRGFGRTIKRMRSPGLFDW